MSTVISIPVVDDLDELTDQQVSEILKLEKLLTGMFKATKAIALKRLMDNKKVPGWEISAGKRSRSWKDEDTAIKTMNAAGMNDPYDHVLLSVAKAEAKLGDEQKDLLKEGWSWKAGNPSMKQTVAGQTSGYDPSVFSDMNTETETPVKTTYDW